MSDFKPFAQAVHKQFESMSKHELFVVDISGDDLFAAYLAAFPEGTNPIFRERTEHDCSCCKNFIRNIGNVVAIIEGQILSIWETVVLEDVAEEYKVVAETLGKAVRNAPIKSLFRATEHQYGAESTVELRDGVTKRWNHFHAKIANKHFLKDPGSVIGEYNTSVGVFKRGLEELKQDAFTTVIDLIQSNNLYRGAEFMPQVASFAGVQSKYIELSPEAKHIYLWQHAGNMAVSRFRNTAIGTLLVDLSDGVDLEAAVKSFEQKVAPTNYKRPNALITQKMVDDAMNTINELGLESALERRFARIEDVPVTDVLFVDNAVRGKMKGGVSDLLASAVAPVAIDAGKAIEIAVDEFLANIVPKAKSMEVLVKNSQQANFVSITAPVHDGVEKLFKWDNNFSISYDGNVTDSIKERVKAAGGKTDAAFRVSLAWFNYDDLDLHAIEPDHHEIYFGNRGYPSANTGKLDVDMNAGSGRTREAVENIVWTRPKDGVYKIDVHNYNQRETIDAGYTLEVECNGEVHHYSSKTSPRSGGKVAAIDITLKAGKIASVKTSPTISGGSFSQEKWNIQTEKFTKVDTLMLSPNHWGDSKVGNKHTIFILDGCKNPLPTRGIYNEFLKGDLEKHRKVFETLGQKTMCQPTDAQLSGVGFTQARGDAVLVNIDGKKLYNVKF